MVKKISENSSCISQLSGYCVDMKTNTTCSTKEQAERMGTAEAAKLTRRGYPTTLLEVRPVRIEALALDGQSPSEMGYVKIASDRWEAVLS